MMGREEKAAIYKLMAIVRAYRETLIECHCLPSKRGLGYLLETLDKDAKPEVRRCTEALAECDDVLKTWRTREYEAREKRILAACSEPKRKARR